MYKCCNIRHFQVTYALTSKPQSTCSTLLLYWGRDIDPNGLESNENFANELSPTARRSLKTRVCRFKTAADAPKGGNLVAQGSEAQGPGGENPAARLLVKGEEFDLFSEEQTVPMRRLAMQRSATEIDLLVAIFTVTRAAKRYRGLLDINADCSGDLCCRKK